MSAIDLKNESTNNQEKERKNRVNNEIYEITSYKPFPQKTGILYHYKWIAFFWPLWTLHIILLLIHGFYYDKTYLASYFTSLLVSLFIVPFSYILLNWIYRKAVDHVNNIFFDDQRTIKLFKNEEAFVKYRTSFYRTLYNKKELIISVIYLGVIIYIAIGVFTNQTLSIYFIIGYLLYLFLYGLVVLAFGSGTWYVFTIFYKFYKFVPKQELSISNYLTWFNKLISSSQTLDAKELQTTLYTFQHNTRVIGQFLFSFFFRFIIFLVVIDLIIYLPSFIDPNVNTAASIFWVPGTLMFIVLFVLAQYKIHIILKEAKEKVIDGLNIFYNNFKLSLYQMFYDKNWEEQKGIMEQISFIKSELDEISAMGTWTYDFPAILKMVAVSLITIIPLIFEFLNFMGT